MSDFIIFIVGIAITLITGMGVITSQVFIAYKKPELITKSTGELTPTV